MLSFRSAPTSFHLKRGCGGSCRRCRYNRMRHVGKGGVVSSSTSLNDGQVADEANAARARAFIRACRSANLTKVRRMISSGCFEIEQEHIDAAHDNDALLQFLVRSAVEMKGVSISKPWCPDSVSLPLFAVEHVLEGKEAFVTRRSGRFAASPTGSCSFGKLGHLPRRVVFQLLWCVQGREVRAWQSLSRAFAFELCDTAEFANLLYQNTFRVCYAGSQCQACFDVLFLSSV